MSESLIAHSKESDDQRESETLAEWVERCGIQSVERKLELEFAKYGAAKGKLR